MLCLCVYGTAWCGLRRAAVQYLLAWSLVDNMVFYFRLFFFPIVFMCVLNQILQVVFVFCWEFIELVVWIVVQFFLLYSLVKTVI